jgi:hypothetical protein
VQCGAVRCSAVRWTRSDIKASTTEASAKHFKVRHSTPHMRSVAVKWGTSFGIV